MSSSNSLRFLSYYHTVVLVNDSASMAHGGLWRDCSSAVGKIASTVSEFDPAGIEIIFTNKSSGAAGVTSSHQVARLFQEVIPSRGSAAVPGLNRILKPYLEALKSSRSRLRPLNIMVITNSPNDDQDFHAVLLQTSKALGKTGARPGQILITAFQAQDASRDAELADFLEDLESFPGGFAWGFPTHGSLDGKKMLQQVKTCYDKCVR